MQRVRDCTVRVENVSVGSIGSGLLVYLGIESKDDERDIRYLADKILNLRIFTDEQGKMNHSVIDKDAELLVVSQFTLHADVRKGRRPSYDGAAPTDQAEPMYEAFLKELEALWKRPERGRFGAHMEVSYTNSGPVTILLDSKKLF